MFKYVFNIVGSKRFSCFVEKSENLRTFFQKNRKMPLRKSYCQLTLAQPFVKTNSYAHFALRDKKPVVLLSGVLSYLGLKEKTPEEKESELIMTIKKGIYLMQIKEYEKSEIMLHTALKMAHEENDEDAITYIYDVLANLAFETSQYNKAEKLFVNVLQRLFAKGEEEGSNKVIHISLKLAKIFQDLKDHNKAEKGFKFCIETLDKKLDDADEDTLALWGMSLDWYARFLLSVGKNYDALNCFRKAYEMCVKLNGEKHEQTVVLLNDLGTVSSLIGDSETALSYYEKARDIGKALPEMKDLSVIYLNLGQLYLGREMYAESKAACEEGLRIAEAADDEVVLAEVKQCLANIEKVFKGSNNNKELKHVGLTDSKGHKGVKKVGLV